MKLAIDCRMIGSGGIGTYISELIPFFLEKNQCLLLGTHEQCTPFLRMENVEFCFCDVKPFSINEIISFPQDILTEINLCDAYYTPYCNIPGGINIPTFSTIHDVVFLDIKGLASPIGTFLRKIMYKRAIDASNAIFTVSEFSKERILKKLHCKKPIIVGYNGISSWILKNNDNLSKKHKNNSILFVGNIKKHKGLSVLITAFKKVLESKPELKLVIVGNADNFRTGDETVSENIKSLPESSIIFTGKINNEELKERYINANLLIQPSFYEGFGIPPLEALYCGTNVVLSDIPVFKELYNDFPVNFFKCGDAQDLTNQILLHLNDSNPKDFTSFYSYSNTAKIILEHIQTVI